MPHILRWDKFLLSIGLIVAFYLFLTHFHSDNSTPFSKSVLSTEEVPDLPENRVEFIQDAFRHAWTGYRKYAFPNNDLRPLTKSYDEIQCAWGTTAVEALTTAIIMDEPEMVYDVIDLISNTEYNRTNMTISMLRSTTRFMASMMSAHDLLTYEKPGMIRADQPISVLLDQARNLADWLSFTFDTPSHLPANVLQLAPEPKRMHTNWTDITAAGTLDLEWTHLSVLTGEDKYSKLVEDTINKILDAADTAPEKPFPGLIGQMISLETGQFMNAAGAWHSGAGAFYEYLLKMYIYNPERYARYGELWRLAADASMDHLASHPSTRPDLTFLASYAGQKLVYDSDHTAHLAAGSFLLGGSVFHEQKYIDFGLKLVDTQVKMHLETPTGLGCEKYMWLPARCASEDDNMDDGDCIVPPEIAEQDDFYQHSGYYITNPLGRLRPEVLESLYYAYRVTGDRQWQDKSFQLFKNMVKMGLVKTGGFSTIQDVMEVPGLDGVSGRVDMMECYFLAETVKYAYLTQVEDGPWQTQANGQSQYVFNTEAHPLRVQLQPTTEQVVTV